MNTTLLFRISLALGCAMGITSTTHAGQTLRLSDTPIGLKTPASAQSALVSLALPDGRVVTTSLTSGDDILPLPDGPLTDGLYRYQVTYASSHPVAQPQAAQNNGRAQALESRSQSASTPPATDMVRSGSFRITDGEIVPQTAQPEPGSEPHSTSLAPGILPSQTISGDLTVYNSACIGTDCAAAENYGFDTLRLKENNTQINFDDTSSSGAFPSNDWTLRANDSANGGMSRFMIIDATADTIPFSVQAGARENALFIDDTDRIGFGTTTPVLSLHMKWNNTPGLRLEQDNSAGWSAQTWDVAANEANFFIRDATNGSSLPFRIKPGAEYGSLAIGLDGHIGIGMDHEFPDVALDVRHNQAAASPVDVIRVSNADGSIDAAQTDRFVVDSNGNVTARGSIVQLSSRTVKDNFTPVDAQSVLDRVAALKIGTWNYKTDSASDRHMGPVAEDFHQQFELGGSDNRHIAVTDMGGVALAAVQALQQELKTRDSLIKALEKRINQLEAMQGAHPTAQR